MIFHGFQKMTLLDYPGKVACTVFTGGCNFRCPFCHNALLVTQLNETETYDESEILSFLDKRHGLLDGVAITGGEPLINDDIIDFIKKVKAKGYAVKLDTNGSYPDRLKKIINENLVDYIAMDIKNSKEKYAETIGIKDFNITPVEKSVEILLSGKVDYEFRTTVVKKFHTVDDIDLISKWIKGAKRYFLQSFIDSGNLIENGLDGVSKEDMEQMKIIAAENIPSTQLRGT